MAVKGYSVHQLDIQGHPAILANSSANTARMFLCWKYLQRGPSQIKANLTLAEAEANGNDYTTAFLQREELQAGINTTLKDFRALQALSLRLLASVGDGGANCLPEVTLSNDSSRTVMAMDPNIVGQELYLAHTYVLSRALVRLARPFARAIQLANELNYCWVAALGGEFHWANKAATTSKTRYSTGTPWPAVAGTLLEMRSGGAGSETGQSWLEGLLGAWANASFIDELAGVLQRAAKAEAPELPTTINYMADVPSSFSKLAGMPHWTELAIRDPWQAVDVVSIDTYPNFLFAKPPRGDVVGERVATAKSVASGKDVWVLETGIGVLGSAGDVSYPSLDFNEEAQANYFQSAWDHAQSAGATGFVMFGWWEDPGIVEPAGGYTATDSEAVRLASAVYLNGTDSLPEFLDFVATNAAYAVERMPDLFMNVSTHFGVFAMEHDVVSRKAREVLETLFREDE